MVLSLRFERKINSVTKIMANVIKYVLKKILRARALLDNKTRNKNRI